MMKVSKGLLFLPMLVGALLTAAPAAGQPIAWRSQAAKAGVQVATVNEVLQESRGRHAVVQFDAIPDDAHRARLAADGIMLLDYLGSQAFFASVAKDGVASKDARGLGVTWAAPVAVEWKLHPMVASGSYPGYALFEAAGLPAKSRDGIVEEGVTTAALYVIFHRDVDLFAEGEAAVLRHGGETRDYMASINAAVIWMPLAEVRAFAMEDAVQWLEPPLPPLEGVNDSSRARMGVDTVNAPPYNLDGSGVNVLLYDSGTARSTHVDFGGRLSVRDASGMAEHPTHVAGTIGGDGTASGGTFRGMAPGVTIQSYGFEYDGSDTFLYTNPGDLEANYLEAIQVYGAEISNNSIGTNTAWNGFPCEFEGDYGATSILIDQIVRGGLGTPMRVVWANGNERGGACGNLYATTAPPAGAKNHISVGALNSDDDSMTDFSSWGPTDDGRLKPDVSAPGCQTNGDMGVTSCIDASDTAYGASCGTSMAAPGVTGVCALILQDWKARVGAPLPRNSTLKVLLAHNAADRGNVGPDYRFGYGSVRAQATIDFARLGTFVEDTLSQSAQKLLFVDVPPGTPALKATLAWDDYPGAANTIPELVNDLDLVAIAPGGGSTHYPWTLDPANPGNPAIRTQPDRRNNIVQVVVDEPTPGTWTIRVTGHAVPQGPQVFSVATTPSFSTSTARGTISLDASQYACADTAEVTVNDSDLNTNAAAADTAVVSVSSDTEPFGESAVLTETGANTGTFAGAIALSSVDANEILQVLHGDTVTVTYVDADDGQGGTDVLVTDTASIDCVAPSISNVSVSATGPRRATVTFDTGEPATGTVRYGGSCAALTETRTGIGLHTSHGIVLGGLLPTTDYYLHVEAADAAGNASMDDNDGACFSFTTTEQPDYLTEVFTGDLDLANGMLVFVPDETGDFYDVCFENASAFPTNPAGGTPLTLSDDDSLAAALSGGAQVALYGESYDTVYVGSNGYLTFGSEDFQWADSPAAHFALPRVSALFRDLDPSAGGTISWRQLSDRAVFTYQDVPEFLLENSNNFQVELFFDGVITITYLQMDSTFGIAGVSAGDGAPLDFVESDLSASDACDALRVTPGTALSASGFQGSSFTPALKTYTLTNANPAVPFNWTAGGTQPWLTVTPGSGTLSSATPSVQVTVGFNTAANSLIPGTYSDTVTFTNTSTAHEAGRAVSLEVLALPGEILVNDSVGSATDLLVPFGDVIETLERIEQVTAINTDGAHDLIVTDIYIDAAAPAAFTLGGLPPLPATVPPGGFISVNVVFEPPEMGTYSATLQVESNDSSEPQVAVSLTGTGIADDLAVTPAEDFVATGPPSGPFSPPSKTYTLTNNGGASLNWTASDTATWLSVDPNLGLLAPGASTPVTATLNANAAALGEGSYTDAVIFTNVATTKVTVHDVALSVVLPPPDARVEVPSPLAANLYPNNTVVFTNGLSVCNDEPIAAALEYEIVYQFTSGPGMDLSTPERLSVEQAINAAIERSGILDGPIKVTGKRLLGPQNHPDGTRVYTRPEEIASSLTAKQMGVAAKAPGNAAVYAADDESWRLDVQTKLLETGQFSGVSTFDTAVITPTLPELLAFDAVLVYSNHPHADATALGNVLADYADAGGGVVCAMLELGSATWGADYVLGGRWGAGGYALMQRDSAILYTTQEGLGAINDPGHAILAGVTSFDGGAASLRPATTTVFPNVNLLAEWSDGHPLVAVRSKLGIMRADIGFFPVSDDASPGLGLWNPATDGARLLANAMTWASDRLSWVTVEAPTSGSVGPSACHSKNVTIDSSGLIPGTYTANIVVSHNDPDQDAFLIPSQLIVEGWGGFLEQPRDAMVYLAETHTFSAETSHGSLPIQYQWKWDDGSGSTQNVGTSTPTYQTPAASPAIEGTYWCEVTYDGILHVSDTASLITGEHLTLTGQPQGGDKLTGDAHTLQVTTTGGFQPLSYVWLRNGTPVASGPELTLAPLELFHAGTYTAQVSDAATDVVVSNPAVLQVTEPVPVISGAGLLVAMAAALATGAFALRRR
ncbi:MAG: S8 family serine peptidase [Nitrospiraceae bacterium]|nr:S8 family serine peptidase [Nitrospiraceae bacterium]